MTKNSSAPQSEAHDHDVADHDHHHEGEHGCSCDHDDCHCGNGECACGDDCECGEDCTCEHETHDKHNEVDALQAKLEQAVEAELRSKADYHNLVRRTQEERSRLVKLAALGVVESLLEPLDHLRLASEHLNDQGLNMVVKQLWQKLEDQGVKPLDVMGKKFNEQQMEVVSKEGEGDTVKKIVAQGYTLNGEVIRHAKVVVG